MKKTYTTPIAQKIEFCYNNQVVASSTATDNCYWKNDGFWSHATSTCKETYHEGTATQVPA